MKLKANLLAFEIPFVKKLNSNSTILKIIKAFCVAFFISNSIYLCLAQEFGYAQSVLWQMLSPFLAIYGFVLLLRMKGDGWFWTGFFVSLLWFYWISLSSIYYGLHYIIPLELLGIGLFYGILFRLCYAFHYDFLRLLGLFCLPFIHFLEFDWLNWGVLSVYGIFDASWRGIACIFLIAYFYYEGYISRYYKIFIITMLILLGMQYKDTEFNKLQSDFKLINTHIDEATKFDKNNVAKNADFVISEILKAIDVQKELVVFPESTFAFDLQKGFGGMYFELLKEFSNEIMIIVGAPYSADGKFYNSAYIFGGGEVKILHKHYLVAFGEEMPQIPFVSDFVRKHLMPNMAYFTRGAAFNEYDIGTQRVTNAICFEATKEELYKKSKIVIAISNNAWFDNLVEPALQRLLISFYASKYGVAVYHATNAKHTGVITPKKSLFLALQNQLFNENSSADDERVNLNDENSSINDENSSLNAEFSNENDTNSSLDENAGLNDENLSVNLNDKNSSVERNLSLTSDKNSAQLKNAKNLDKKQNIDKNPKNTQKPNNDKTPKN